MSVRPISLICLNSAFPFCCEIRAKCGYSGMTPERETCFSVSGASAFLFQWFHSALLEDSLPGLGYQNVWLYPTQTYQSQQCVYSTDSSLAWSWRMSFVLFSWRNTALLKPKLPDSVCQQPSNDALSWKHCGKTLLISSSPIWERLYNSKAPILPCVSPCSSQS